MKAAKGRAQLTQGIRRMCSRHKFLKRTSFLLLGTLLLIQSTVLRNGQQICNGAEPIEVEQAGDHFVNFVLGEIETARKQLPAITRAAEAAADRIVNQNGELLSAGDQIFSLEPVWRAGGIAFSRQYKPDKQEAAAAVESANDKIPYYRTKEFVEHFTVQAAKSKDVVLLGYENEKEEQLHLASHVKQLLSDEALIVFFGSQKSAQRLEQAFGPRDNLLLITHDVPDGGILEIPGENLLRQEHRQSIVFVDLRG